MQGGIWISLFRRIPPTHHDCLVLRTANGTELVLQRILRLDREFLVALGRLSGSTDNGKVLIVPYDQLTYLSFNKQMSDEEVFEALGKQGIGESAAVAPPAAASPVAVEAPAEANEVVDFTPARVAPAAPPEPPAPSTAKVQPPSKSILLARLRQRLATDLAKPTGS
jgi:hypothetical protein